ncbi:MAG TPA: hypothetical protein VK365_00960 [Nocardioidaceae bacterium]|jgi:hypothetical protein|nr:hypothetical protein [Nocardioidaceae bacterium]
MELLLAAIATVASSALLGFVLVRRAARALRRRLDRARDRALLLARAYGAGPSAEVARLRREMTRSVAGARRALDAARAVNSPVGDVPALLARLELAAQSVDGELRVLEVHPDRARRAVQLAGPRSRAEVICSSAARLADGLLQAAGHGEQELGLLQVACAIEADSLRAAATAHPADVREARPAQQHVSGWHGSS